MLEAMDAPGPHEAEPATETAADAPQDAVPVELAETELPATSGDDQGANHMNKSDDFPLTDAINQMTNANRSQIAQGLHVQTYFNSVIQQPLVDFSDQSNLEQFQSQINQTLTAARDHASQYLDTIQPLLMANITNMVNYFCLHQAIPDAYPPGATAVDWIEALSGIQAMAQGYVSSASTANNKLKALYDILAADSGSFSTLVANLNSAVNGDNGALTALESKVNAFQEHIDVTIAGNTVSALGAAGVSYIGAVGDIGFVTEGSSTPVVLGGIALVADGTGAELAAAMMLAQPNDQKAETLRLEADLEDKVKLAVGLSSAYGSLKDQMGQAVTAATAMESAWNVMGAALGDLIDGINRGAVDVGTLATLYATAAHGILTQVLADLSTIHDQMVNVRPIVASPGQTVGQAIVAAVQGS